MYPQATSPFTATDYKSEQQRKLIYRCGIKPPEVHTFSSRLNSFLLQLAMTTNRN